MKTAIVHDWLITYGGAERVLEQMLKVFPEADLFALYDFIPEGQRDFIQNKPVTTSFLQRFPFARKKYRSYLPFMPLAVEQFDLSGYELVISSNHAVAKGVVTGQGQVHISYLNGVMAYAWDMYHYYLEHAKLLRGIRSSFARVALHYIRLWDVSSSNRVDYYVANSDYMAMKIRRIYNRESAIIYPPVNLQLHPLSPAARFHYVTVSRLVPIKKVDLIVAAFARMPEAQLFVIGDGPEMKRLRERASPNVGFIGYQAGEVVHEYMSGAKAYITASEEPFGISVVEAQACGTPVIAFGKGGVLETVIENRTGIFFREQTVAAIVDAVKRFEEREPQFDRNEIRANAERFSVERFQSEFRAFVEKAIRDFHDRKGKKLQGDESKTFPKLQLKNRLKNQTSLDLP